MHAPRPTVQRQAALAAAVLIAVAGPVSGQHAEPAPSVPSSHGDPDPTPSENLFAGFETHVLENGLRVWFRHIPGAANTSVGVSIPYGADMDPRGKEEVAHYLEHMLFSDHRGLTEEEIKDQVESIGGRRNGFTTADQTFYYVTLPAQHGLFGIEWLSRIVEPHDMAPEIVARNRQPVALEIRAQPRELFDHIEAVLDPDWLRPPGFWEREFGLRTRESQRYDAYRSLQAITPEDLRGFYDTYYTPEAMTLVVAGDLPPDTALTLVRNTFGRLERRPAPEAYPPAVDPGRGFRQVTWQFRPDVQYRRLFKVYDLRRDNQVKLLFLGRYLGRRLSARLRFGEIKAVYGVSVASIQRGPALYFGVQAPVDEDHWDFARDVIDEELRALADGSADPETFRRDRQAVVERLIAENREAEDLVFWLYRTLNERGRYDDFPDLPAEFAALDQAGLSSFVQEHFTPDHEMVYVDHPQPLTQGALALLVVFLGMVVIRVTARRLTTPADMTRIRYVTRLRFGPPALLLGGFLFLGGGVVVARLLTESAHRMLSWWVYPVDAYLFQMGAFALLGAAGLALLIVYASLPPRKLLVFPDHVRVKARFYRSRVIPLDEIRWVGPRRLGDVRRAGVLGRTLPMSFGMLVPALHLQPASGLGYLFRVRDPEELLSVLRELGVPVAEAAD